MQRESLQDTVRRFLGILANLSREEVAAYELHSLKKEELIGIEADFSGNPTVGMEYKIALAANRENVIVLADYNTTDNKPVQGWRFEKKISEKSPGEQGIKPKGERFYWLDEKRLIVWFTGFIMGGIFMLLLFGFFLLFTSLT
jgi:hypothetical protein